ncbi:Ypt/Rab-GAP domain of gyp1p superfamily protein [Raphanus sativus]|uniref:Uncharacterized protein LOC108815885 isoform X2 n=1 Tax=Raphanus sativus TaxID=3726 RepID=A0A6J0K943_RAPSA|nr:uncharacterized protein LOC108815885 isoform X2 [Raphanus sativus]KAJ4884755.1 Ypt/Rab-GAP domain of gyp1p superfamily protein [Raphanus sativus]
MCSGGGEVKQWSCVKAGVVSLQKVRSFVRDLTSLVFHSHTFRLAKCLSQRSGRRLLIVKEEFLVSKKALKLISLGGIDPSIRAEVWKFLLGCYELSSTSEHRNQLRLARSTMTCSSNARRCIQAWELVRLPMLWGLKSWICGNLIEMSR